MKPTLEEILFLNPVITTNEYVNKLANLSVNYEISKSYKNIKKYTNEIETSKRYINENISDEDLEKIVVDVLKSKDYPTFVKYFQSNYKDSLDKSTKSAQKSVEARIKANELFAKDKHDFETHKDIWRLYSTSIAVAPILSKELILGYECRSNFLLHIKKYHDCIKDIDRALSITDFHLLKVKLLCRKMTCFVAIEKNVEEKRQLWLSIEDEFEKISDVLKDDKILQMVNQAKTDLADQSTKEGEQTKKSSKSFISFPNVALSYGKEIDVIANRDFMPGEEVVVVKPLVTSFNPDRFYAYCSHCLSFMWAGIPCDDCSLCMYCSDKCKAEAWDKYHVLECKLLPHINFDDIIYFDLQSAAKFVILGMREFGSISKLREEVDKFKDKSRLTKNEKLSNSDVLNFFITPNRLFLSKMGKDSISSRAKNACFLIAYMIETGNIFEEDMKLLKGKKLSKNEDIVFAALFMFKIILACRSNIFFPGQTYTNQVECDECMKKTSEKIGLIKRCCIRGRIFHPFKGLFEKSCSPNVTWIWTDDGKLICLCVQPINKLEKIADYSSCEFFKSEKRERDNFIIVYSFGICKCVPCMKKWPTMNELYKKFKHRHLKSEKKEIKIVQKYLEKNDMKIDDIWKSKWTPNESELQELAKDVNDVVKVCGQPSFASSYLIALMCLSYERLNGMIPFESHIPKEC